MPVDIATLDRHLQFLQREQSQLRQRGEAWSDRKADQLGEIAEVLRQVRQERQMTGMGGKRIE